MSNTLNNFKINCFELQKLFWIFKKNISFFNLKISLCIRAYLIYQMAEEPPYL